MCASSMENKKVIFGFVGLLSSGKGTAGQYLQEKYGASFYMFSSILRDILKRLYIEESRDYLQKLSLGLRQTFGQDVLAHVIAEDAQHASERIVIIDGVRRMGDIVHLQKNPYFVLIEIFADERVRYERLIGRGQNTDDTVKTFEEFIEDHKKEAELEIPKVASIAKERIDNNGTLEQLHAQLDALVKKYTA